MVDTAIHIVNMIISIYQSDIEEHIRTQKAYVAYVYEVYIQKELQNNAA